MSTFNSDLNIGERLQTFRADRGLSQNALAKMLNISMRTYQNYERGERSITKEFICTFCERFNMSSDWLLSGEIRKESNINWDTLEDIIQTIEHVLEHESLIIDTHKKVKLISLFYKLSEERGGISDSSIHDMLMLSAG